MPRLKYFDDPSHVRFIRDAVAEDLSSADSEARRDKILFRGLAALSKHNPSSDAAQEIATASGVPVDRLREMLSTITKHAKREIALSGYWQWVHRERDRQVEQVYFVRSGDLVKIGRSRFVKERLNALQLHATTTHQLIGTVPGGYRDERQWHKRFAAIRSHREWFHATEELMTTIRAAIANSGRSAVAS